jgi:hypothetical protein
MGTRRDMTILILIVAVGSMSCSSSDPVETSGTESVAPAVLQTLPGETVGNATNRLLKDCYLQKFGIVAREVSGGVEADMTNATTPTMGYQDIIDVCTSAVNAAGLTEFEPLTDDDLRARYALVLTWHDCIVGQGYDIGPAVSVEEFVAARGSLIWFPGFDAATYGIGAQAFETLDKACPQP